MAPTLRTRIQTALGVQPRSKPEVYARLFEATALTSVNYWLEIIFAAGIATFGLVLNSPAVIIGAMLISPLMSPILATGLALAMGDLYLGIKAVLNLIASLAVSIALAAFMVWLLPFHSPTEEVLSRTNPNLLDLGVAILSGLAGSLVFSRGEKRDGVTALPGVAIAVALMPPLCTIGFGIGSGGNTVIIGGAGLLFLTNLVAIVASAFVVFLVTEMDGVSGRSEIDRSRRAHAQSDPVYRMLGNTALARTLAAGGRIHWRILMIAVLLGALFIPLRNALDEVKQDVLARSAVQEAVDRLAPRGAVVSHQTTMGPREIQIRIISTQNIDAAKVRQTRDALQQRTGRQVDIGVQEVASKSELRALLERMSTPAAVAPSTPPPTLADLRERSLALVASTLQSVWPGSDLAMAGYELAYTPDGSTLRITYQARHDVGPEVAAVLESVLRNELKTPDLTVELKRHRISK